MDDAKKLTKRKTHKSKASTKTTQPQPPTEAYLSRSLVFHLSCLLLYTFVFFYREVTGNLLDDKCRSLLKLDKFGGPYKFLTHLNMCSLILFHAVAFLADVVPALKKYCQSFIDWHFTTIVWPLCWIVFTFFWGLYAIDRELIFPKIIQPCIPQPLNHLVHTVIFPVAILEMLLVHHKHSSKWTAIGTLISLSSLYMCWICLVYYMTGFWVYPFMKYFNVFTFLLFVTVSTVISGGFYYIGKVLCTFRHGHV